MDGQRLVWSLGDLASGGSGLITLTTSVSEEATGEEPIANSALARMSNPPPTGADSTVTSTDSIDVIVLYPDIALSKTSTSTETEPGGRWSTNFAMRMAAKGRRLILRSKTNCLAPELRLSRPGPKHGGRSAPGVVAGRSGFRRQRPDHADDVGFEEATGEEPIANSALARMSNPPASGADSTVTSTDSIDVIVLYPDIALTKQSNSNSVNPGEALVYELRYENGGEGTAVDFEIEDELPSLLSYVSADPAPSTVDGQRLVWSLGDLASGGSGLITLTTSVSEEATGEEPIANSALARMSNPPATGVDSTVTSTDSIDVIVLYPDIALSKTSTSTEVNPGASLVYELRYENGGEGTAVDFEIEDELPSLLSYVSADPAPSTVDGQRLVWSLGDLASGGSGLITLTTSVSEEATGEEPIANSALARMSNPPASGADSTVTSTDSIDVIVLYPDIALSKTSTSTETEPGGQLVYELRYENDGEGTAVGFEIEDELPSLLSYVSADPAPSTVDGQRLVWSLGDLASGGSGLITLTTSVAEDAPDSASIANSALARMSNPPASGADSTVTSTDSIQVIEPVFTWDGTYEQSDELVAGEDVEMRVLDLDQNLSDGEIDSVLVMLVNETDNDVEPIYLKETGPDTGEFTGSLPTRDVRVFEDTPYVMSESAVRTGPVLWRASRLRLYPMTV